MPRWVTSYRNAADEGAPYIGPLLHVETLADAQALVEWVTGPHGEPLTVDGALLAQEPAGALGDTANEIRRV